jgi:hypothetical protein
MSFQRKKGPIFDGDKKTKRQRDGWRFKGEV